MFPHLHTLHLSYNRIPTKDLSDLGNLQSLQVLNLASNNLCTLPANLGFLHSLQELNLSSNNLQATPKDNCSGLFKSLSGIPFLRKLNLSRNKLTEFHSDLLPEHNASLVYESQVFIYLEELYFAFNSVQQESKLFYPVV